VQFYQQQVTGDKIKVLCEAVALQLHEMYLSLIKLWRCARRCRKPLK